ncbi:hypothetical protein HK104_001657 [Borealophlyctis nickersoniae]|nr:hypothetical protein HK104_001657 [Borealophlyctis nickersoniae]
MGGNPSGSERMWVATRKPTIVLDDAKLWAQFHCVGNEMIVTKAGRCLFPALSFHPQDLNPTSTYSMAIDVVQSSPYKFKFRGGKWMEVVDTRENSERGKKKRRGWRVPKVRAHMHPNSPQKGSYWTSHGISFPKLKLTNRYTNDDIQGSMSHSPQHLDLPETHFLLHSFHQYQPRVHVIEHLDRGKKKVTTYTWEETKFVAVTHYQNELVNSLKKNYNPHAKGFKDYETKRTASKVRPSKHTRASNGAPTLVADSEMVVCGEAIYIVAGEGVPDTQMADQQEREGTEDVDDRGDEEDVSEDEDEDAEEQEDNEESDNVMDAEDSSNDDDASASSSSYQSDDDQSDANPFDADRSDDDQLKPDFTYDSPPHHPAPKLHILSLFCSHLLQHESRTALPPPAPIEPHPHIFLTPPAYTHMQDEMLERFRASRGLYSLPPGYGRMQSSTPHSYGMPPSIPHTYVMEPGPHAYGRVESKI